MAHAYRLHLDSAPAFTLRASFRVLYCSVRGKMRNETCRTRGETPVIPARSLHPDDSSRPTDFLWGPINEDIRLSITQISFIGISSTKPSGSARCGRGLNDNYSDTHSGRAMNAGSCTLERNANRDRYGITREERERERERENSGRRGKTFDDHAY